MSKRNVLGRVLQGDVGEVCPREMLGKRLVEKCRRSVCGKEVFCGRVLHKCVVEMRFLENRVVECCREVL